MHCFGSREQWPKESITIYELVGYPEDVNDKMKRRAKQNYAGPLQ